MNRVASAFRRKDRLAWVAAATALTGVLLIQAETKALRPIGNDFTAYVDAARALAHGQNPYLASERFPYSYPLTLAWLLIPLSYFPLWLPTAGWFAVSVYAYWRLVKVAAVGEDGRVPLSGGPIALAIVMAVALLQIVQNELLNGQVNLVVCAISLAAITLSQRGKPVPAAMLWGSGIALKLFPLILGPWFLLRRRWTELFLGGSIAGALALGPVLWTGSDALHWTTDYLRRMAGEAGNPAVPDFIHLNLAGTIGHQLAHPNAAAWLLFGIPVLCVGLAMLADAKRGLEHGVRAAAGYLALVVLLSPKSETHHMIFTVPAAVVLAACARTWTRVAALGALIVIFNIGYVTPAVRDPFLLLFALGIAAWCIAE